MSANSISRFTLSLATSLLLIVTLSFWYPAPVSAECGTGQQISSCINCHQLQTPSLGQSQWHTLHAGKNTCVDCHAGNQTVFTKEQAHLGIFANPLTNVYTNCHACHPSDYQKRGNSFAEILHFSAAGLSAPNQNQLVSNNSVDNEIITKTEDSRKPSAAIDLPIVLILSGGAAVAMVFLFLATINFWRQGQ